VIACNGPPSKRKASDGYYFESETFQRNNFEVEMVLFQTREDLLNQFDFVSKNRVVNIISSTTRNEIQAFSVIRMNDTKCTIYAMDPKFRYQPEFLGHELVHCIYGVWHEEPQR
jgi:hypothetical protein